MTTTVFRRPARPVGPELPDGELRLQEPPALPEAGGTDLSSAFMYLPMAVGSGAMVLLFVQPGAGALTYVAAGLMGVSTLGMLVMMLGRSSGERKRALRAERRDYLRHLAQARRAVRQAATQQARALCWRHPDPGALWTVGSSPRMWERRPGDEDFAEVRLGVGTQHLALDLVPPVTKPVEDLEPLCAVALRRFLHTHWAVAGLPVAVRLPGFAGVRVEGPDDPVRALVRALIAQLVTFHAPTEVRIAACVGPSRQPDWDWLKWLPHALHPALSDAAGPQRLVAETVVELEHLLGPAFADRPRFDESARSSPDEPYTLIVLDGVPVPRNARLVSSIRNATVLDVGATVEWPGSGPTLRLRATPDELELVTTDPNGAQTLGRPDHLGVAGAVRLARRLAPFRIGTAGDAADRRRGTPDLCKLLGIDDPYTFRPDTVRQRGSRWDQLRVPVGLSTNGSPVELDIKEAAQGGMGPHGLLIGATGSGKSELLRTLILALAVTHSSEVLNFVLVDFKGGATFRGFEGLPHTSASITNLAAELPLVDRMREALQGELVRRQEVLRAAGFSAVKEYEKARADGTPLPPLPTLFVVVDEFSELLSAKRDFIDLFVMIGRLGRSLGVHLLLASQRVDEGRVHQLESHLSYRIGLRTFSATESRSVLGVPDAYELPSAPGNGFLRADTTTLIRFRGAYVSAPLGTVTGRPGDRGGSAALVPYPLLNLPELDPVPQPVVDDEPRGETLLDVLLRRLAGDGPRAHRVWLPPLTTSPTLDRLLGPEAAPDFRAAVGQLRVPVGIVDRPRDQRHDPLVADLTGAGGHVGVAGGPQSGKSTLVRALIAALALTHTPTQTQFYCLDFGGGTLSGLARLPHVGAVAGRHQRDLVARIVAEVAELLAQRERRFAAHGIDSMATWRRRRDDGTLPPEVLDGYGDVFLVVDGWSTLHQDFETVEQAFSQLATNGLNYGVHLVVTASRWSEIRPWLRDLLGTRFELRLGDPVDSEVDMRAAANVPERAGRGLTRDGEHFLAALPRIDGVSDADGLGDAVRRMVDRIAAGWPDDRAPAVRLLPDRLSAAELPVDPTTWRVAVGLDEQKLQPVWLDFDAQPHLLVFGDTGTGKTNALRLVMATLAAQHPPDQVRFIVGDARRGLLAAVGAEHQLGYAVSAPALQSLVAETVEPLRRRLPGPDVTPEQLSQRGWWSGPRLVLVVDDYDLVTNGRDSALAGLHDLIAHGADIGLHLVLARATSGAGRAMMFDEVLRRIYELGTPSLLLSCDRQEGAFLGDAQPRALPTGRAQFVTRRHEPLLVQLGCVTPGGA